MVKYAYDQQPTLLSLTLTHSPCQGKGQMKDFVNYTQVIWRTIVCNSSIRRRAPREEEHHGTEDEDEDEEENRVLLIRVCKLKVLRRQKCSLLLFPPDETQEKGRGESGEEEGEKERESE